MAGPGRGCGHAGRPPHHMGPILRRPDLRGGLAQERHRRFRRAVQAGDRCRLQGVVRRQLRARQADRQGAPAEIFISADLEWMDDVAKRELIRPRLARQSRSATTSCSSRRRASTVTLQDRAGFRARGRARHRAAGGGRSGGRAGRPVREGGADVARRVERRRRRVSRPPENVRAALLLVSRGEAPLGIVYRTDALAEPGVASSTCFPSRRIRRSSIPPR